MKKNIKIIRSTVSLATLHNRRDFSKRFATLEKYKKAKDLVVTIKPKEKGKQNA